jgi:hypothetical protein
MTKKKFTEYDNICLAHRMSNEIVSELSIKLPYIIMNFLEKDKKARAK